MFKRQNQMERRKIKVYYNNLNSIFFKMNLNKKFEMFFCPVDLDPQKEKRSRKESHLG